MSYTLNELRKEYSKSKLDESTVQDDPFSLFDQWLEEAALAKSPEPNAMALSTVDTSGAPSSRIVLLKEVRDGGFYFFTNYLSKKGQDITTNNKVSLLFFWHELERQIRITGSAEKIPGDQTKEYFITRPRLSRLGALSSRQSEVIPHRLYLEQEFEKNNLLFPDDDIPCPDYWGGYKVTPTSFEFWQGRENRLHDRIVYLPSGEEWAIQRLSP